MSVCDICAVIANKSVTVYEDEKVVAALHPQGIAPGHLLVMPRNHASIIEQVPDFVTSELFVKANILSRALVENLGCAGTDVLLQNGLPANQRHTHSLLHVIPRFENDGLNFQWKPRQLSEEEFSTIELKLKEETKNIGDFENEKPKPIEEKKPEVMIETKESKDVDYRLRQLRRIP